MVKLSMWNSGITDEMVRVTVIGKLVILIYEENQIDKNIEILFAIFGNVGMVQTNNQ